MSNPGLDQLCINTIRFLAIDAVEQANSGHPGAPMGMAPMAYTLWDRHLKHNPANPKWPDRDRFVLSAGHASALLYALLHLTGYDLPLDEVKRFRQWGSQTPGHPEFHLTPGVETTTGPLGQGFANGVGMAIAERALARRYNRPGFELFNHYTYTVVSDGDLQEGVASEAASLAGHLKLGKLVYLYDDNDISIDGPTEITFTEDVKQRFLAYGWNVVGPVDGMDVEAVDTAIRTARSQSERPSLIICRTIIGYGSPNKANRPSAHGEPLGKEETKLTRENLKWPYGPFEVPPEALAHLRQAVERGRAAETRWQELLDRYRATFPTEARQLEADLRGDLPEGWDKGLSDMFKPGDKPLATREALGRLINKTAETVRNLTGGSADLAGSVKTLIKDSGDCCAADYSGRNIRFGVREHAMGSISNGIALHGGLIPFTGTFLVFYDYMRPPIRLAALIGLHVIFVFSHDSVGLGEDGPTHQPVEQLMGLRIVPNLVTIRPADATETAEAWKIAMERRDGPTALICTRQNLPVLDRSQLAAADGVRCGGYVLWETGGMPQVILIGTGSEVHIALEGGRLLQAEGVHARVVSLPSWELFDTQPLEYRESVLPLKVKARVSIEAGVTVGWEHYIGLDGIAIGLNRFGASAPGPVLYEQFGLTARRMADEAKRLIRR
ncbi:MAG: transketolase [Chloroflexota bacterium]